MFFIEMVLALPDYFLEYMSYLAILNLFYVFQICLFKQIWLWVLCYAIHGQLEWQDHERLPQCNVFSPISSYITAAPAYLENIFLFKMLGFLLYPLTHTHCFFDADHYLEIHDGYGLQDVPFRSQQSWHDEARGFEEEKEAVAPDADIYACVLAEHRSLENWV